MNALKTFDFKQHQVRTITIDNEPWFIGKDVATILGYRDTSGALRKHVDKEDKGGVEMATPGGKQNLTAINESGLYSLILSSKLPQAKEFKRWVTKEVLPAIRKTGSYNAQMFDPNNLTAEQKIKLLLEASSNANERVEKVEERVTALEDNRLLNPNEYGFLAHQISSRIKVIKDVYNIKANREQNRELFRAINRDINQVAGVRCRSQIRYKDFELAIEHIQDWIPSKATLHSINQLSLDLEVSA